MDVHVLILNYNGRRLLAECLPSVLRAAGQSRHRCDVAVIDNDSSDDSVAWLSEQYPGVRVIERPNRGLCSFNGVVCELRGRVAILLNNDIRLDSQCIDPLVEPFLERGGCFLTAPLCWRVGDGGYEGFRTAIDWRWGLVQATALYPGHEQGMYRPGLTASAGAAIAVDCQKFAELGGFDPLYLPGRLEDLDLAFRAYLAGYHARYVPAAVAWHLGMATFREVYGDAGCERLALRNTLLFQWKNLRHPRHLARQAVGLPLRVIWDVVRAASVSRQRRWAFCRALWEAAAVAWRSGVGRFKWPNHCMLEAEFFRRFRPGRAGGIDGPSSSKEPDAPYAEVGDWEEAGSSRRVAEEVGGRV